MTRATMFLLVGLSVEPLPCLSAQEPARQRTDSLFVARRLAVVDSALRPVRRALAADSALQRAPANRTQFVLLRATPDSGVVYQAQYRDRQALHWAGRAQGPLASFGWFRAGQVSAAAVFYYVSRAERAAPRSPGLIPDLSRRPQRPSGSV